ncbi:MAG: four-carbon acid sugar kinase family protein [Treponema sp.]|jgi:uncharacterized protein YgbK (DUF1537 family)|nr:four-carbon acid sugar kinase family protein [Treponema sp.]
MLKAMYTLLVLADDLTGALDTGLQFSKKGIPTQVYPGLGGSREPGKGEAPFPAGAEGTLVINTATRHCSSAAALRITGGILERYSAVPYVYKKTDSTLRGNIGAELEALIRARNPKVLPFIPAYPNLGRSTRQGRQYIDGVPIDKAASDALNPLRHSFIPDIIAEESELPVRLVSGNSFTGDPGEIPGGTGPEIWVYDAESNARLRDIARSLGERKLLGTTAGCAGFAEFLADRIPFAGMGRASFSGPEKDLIPASRPLLVICGSRHPVSLIQVKAAQDAGIPALAVEGDKLFRPRWLEGEEAASIVSRCGELLRAAGCCILGTRISLGFEGDGPPQGPSVAGFLGKLTALILERSGPLHLAVFGGDTLLGIIEALGCRLLHPLREIRPGVVLAGADFPGGTFFIASKSGAFGEPGLIVELVNFFGGDAAAFTK